MVKVTFTLHEETIEQLRRAAARLGKPQSAIVREAIHDYADRMGRLSADERRRMLAIIDRVIARPPIRSQREVDREIAAVRAARRSGGRRRSR
jgi:predicted DNA-binding protein